MDLNDIALFVNVVRAGSFAEAGRRLGIPPSTASRRIQALEVSLGVRLMQRTTRRLVLTETGRNFFAESADQIDALQRVAGDVSDGSSEVAGRVRIAVPVDFFNWFPASEVARFCAENPRIRLEFELDDARADLLGQGIDVALRSGDKDLSLIARQVGTSHAKLFASPEYVAAKGIPVSPRELSSHNCITSPVRGGPRTTWRLVGPGNETTSVEVDGPFQANTSAAQLAGAVAGLGIALLPVLLAAQYLTAGRLQEVLPDYGSGTINVHLVYLSRRQLPRAVSAFIDFAVSTIKGLDLMQVDKLKNSNQKAPPRRNRKLK